ncbi:protein toll-like [Zeugodacus cucurbitae]|uniref:protein toll-like n=1 Tax=Zeugodacus cucurbitae TaxID=28588 RepID=UPI0023D958A5|nr:protein toll-like [Zeugodacus cucurbitae]
MCECTSNSFQCILKTKLSLVNVEASIRSLDENDTKFVTYAINITCDYVLEDLDVVLNLMPAITLSDRTEFYLKNCVEFPAILQQPHVTYEGTVEFIKYLETPSRFFNQSQSLQRLTLPVKLFYVDITPLPHHLFHNLTNLQHLKFKILCTLPEIRYPAELFHTLFNLETLSIELTALKTSLRDIQHSHFRDLSALKQLTLEGNHMLALPAELFTTLPELRRLSLRLNNLRMLPRDLLRIQRKLLVLDLSENQLSALPKGIFDNTPLLCELDLALNRFSVPTNIIENVHALGYLRKFNLGYNRFETIWGAGIYRNHTLFTRTNITDAQWLSNFPDMVKYVAGWRHIGPNYTEVVLRNNRLIDFSLDWIAASGVSCPYYIDLANNHISHVYAILSPSNATCWQEVHLINNPLVCDCELAWIYNTNLLNRAVTWQCALPEHLADSDLQTLQRAALCPWSPAWCPSKCRCSKQTSALLINCTAADLQALNQLPRPEQLSLTETALDLTHNQFRELPSNATFGYANVTHLFATHNRLNTVLPTHLPPALRSLDLRTNQLERLSESFLRAYLNESAILTSLYLSDNPWLCDCSTELLLYTLRIHRSRIPDIEELFCANLPNVTLANVTFTDICVVSSSSWTLLAQVVASFLVILTLLTCIALYYKYELELKIWLHAHNVNISCCGIDELDCNATFDAFISYAHEQSDYVNQILVPGLEQTAPHFRICTHERNWLAGAYIPEQIVESVAQSRRTIIVLSQDFVASLWARMEFKTAHQFAVNERRARIIIIKYGEVADMAGLDSGLQAYLRMNTYLESEDPRFWQKLRYAMPHRRGEGRKAGMLEVGNRVYVCGQVERNQMANKN